MQDIKVNVRYRDEQGNIIHIKPYEPQEPVQILRDMSIALAVLGGLIWAFQHILNPATAV